MSLDDTVFGAVPPPETEEPYTNPRSTVDDMVSRMAQAQAVPTPGGVGVDPRLTMDRLHRKMYEDYVVNPKYPAGSKAGRAQKEPLDFTEFGEGPANPGGGETDFSDFGHPTDEQVPLPPPKPEEIKEAPEQKRFGDWRDTVVDAARAAKPYTDMLPSLAPVDLAKKAVGPVVDFAKRAYEGYQNEADAPKAEPPKEDGDLEIKKGFQGGWYQNAKMFGRAAEVWGRILGSNDLEELGKHWTEYGKTQSDPYNARVAGAENIRYKEGLWPFLQDVGSFAGYQTGQAAASSVPSFGGALAGQAIGGAAGELTAGPPGAAVGAKIGQLVGMALPSYVQNLGDVGDDVAESKAIQKAITDGKISQKWADAIVATAAVPMAALDTYSEYSIFGKKFLEKAKTDLKKRLVEGVVNGAITEGTTEGLQQVISEWAQDYLGGDKSAYQQMLSVVNNFLGGAFGGVLFGAAGALPGEKAPVPGSSPPPAAAGPSAGPGHTGAPPPGGGPTPGAPPAPPQGLGGPNFSEMARNSSPEEAIAILRQRGFSDEDIAGMDPSQFVGEVEQGLRDGQGQAQRPGTRSAPVAPEDLGAAEGTINGEPTPGQREAGNYQHLHTELPELGLTGRNGISIETRMGGIRQGPMQGMSPEDMAKVEANVQTLQQARTAALNANQPIDHINQQIDQLTASIREKKPSWTSPQLPAAYGRSKQIMGADSTTAKPQGLDFFIGNAPAGGPVYVIDQFDPKTGKFDEHKVMARFAGPADAIKAYLGSYSDNAASRIGGMQPMSADEFKAWTKTGKVAKRPVSPAGLAMSQQQKNGTGVKAAEPPATGPSVIAPEQPAGSEGVRPVGEAQQQPQNAGDVGSVPESDKAMQDIANLFGETKAPTAELSTETPQQDTVPPQGGQPDTAERSQNREEQIEAALQAAGADPRAAAPVAIHRAAELMESQGWDPVTAFGAALVQLAYEHQQFSLEQLYDAYGKDNVDAILHASDAHARGVSTEEAGAGPGREDATHPAEPVLAGSEAGEPQQGADEGAEHPAEHSVDQGTNQPEGHEPGSSEAAEQSAGEPGQEPVPEQHEQAAEAGQAGVIPPELWKALRDAFSAETNDQVSTSALSNFADMLEGVAESENSEDTAKVLENVKLLRAEVARRQEAGESAKPDDARAALDQYLAQINLPIESIVPRDLHLTLAFMADGWSPAEALERAVLIGGLIDKTIKLTDSEFAGVSEEVKRDLEREAATRRGGEDAPEGGEAPEGEGRRGPTTGDGQGTGQGNGVEHPAIGRPESGAEQEHAGEEQQPAGPEPGRKPPAGGEPTTGTGTREPGGESATGGGALLTAKAGDIIATERGERIQLTGPTEYNKFHKIYYGPGRRWIKKNEKWSSNVLIHNFRSFTVEGAEEAAEPDREKIEDVGEKIGGARKHEWAGIGLSDEQIDKLNPAERAKHITKENVWPRPDYAGAVADGMPAEVMFAVKRVYDRLPTEPQKSRDHGSDADAQQQYINVLRAVRETFLKLVTKDATLRTLDDAVELVNEIVTGQKRPGYSSEDFRAAMRSRNGRLDFTHPADVTYEDRQYAQRAVEKGWPNLAPWTRSYFLHTNSHWKDGKIVGHTWLVVQKHPQTVVSTHPTEAAAKEAARVLYENRDDEEGEGTKYPKRPILDSIVRNGTDVRGGKDVTADQLKDEFGFRGVQWGNHVTQDERQDLVNLGFDALHDLAAVLGISPKAISLDGTLGAAFGARGRGGRAAAHYEPVQVVFNMTRKNGAGSLAHEWAHALDHYLGELNTPNAYGGKPKSISGWDNIKVNETTYKDNRHYASERRNQHLSPRLRKAANDLMQALHYKRQSSEEALKIDADAQKKDELLQQQWTDILKRSESKMRGGTATSADRENASRARHNLPIFERRIADRKAHGVTRALVETSYFQEAQKLSGSGKYWRSPTEMFARALEAYVFDKLAEKGVTSQYLVHSVEPNRFGNEWKGNPFPTVEEREDINVAFDKFFGALTVKAGKLGEGTKLDSVEGNVEPEDLSVWKVDRPKATDMVEEMKDLEASSEEAANQTLAGAFMDHFADGGQFRTILEARKFAMDKGHNHDAKAVEEAIENAIVQVARREVDSTIGGAKEHFEELLDLYNRQPRLGTRTSTSVREQAYSTPIPLAFIASRLAGVTPETTVLEPTAGNGALLIETNPEKASVNEINPTRAKALTDQGFRVSQKDAADGKLRHAGYPVDVVLANPPFGVVKDGEATKTFDLTDIQAGYKTNEIDHAIALRALASMKDDGKAVLIIGGLNKQLSSEEARSDGYNGKAKREFFVTLYKNYKVVDHFTVAGELYERQGAGWPVDVIVIDGRGASTLRLPAASVPRIYTSWDQLGGLLDENAPRSAQGVRSGAGEATEGTPAGGLGEQHVGVPESAGRSGDRDGSATGEGPAGVREGSLQQLGAEPAPGERGTSQPDTGGVPESGRAGAETAPSGRPSGLTEADFGKAFDDYLGPAAEPTPAKAPERRETRQERITREAAAVGYSIPHFKDWRESLAWMKDRIAVYDAMTKDRHGWFDDLIFEKGTSKRRSNIDEVARLEPIIAADNLASHEHLRLANSSADNPTRENEGRPYSGTIQGYYDHFKSLVDRLDRHPQTKAQLDEARARVTGKQTRTTAEVAKATVTSAAETADAALAGLSALFGGPKVSMGVSFDKDTYEKAKPLFAKAAEKFGQFKDNLIELMKHMMAELETVYGMAKDAIARMRPYVIRFMQDVQSGAIKLFPEATSTEKPAQPKSMKKDTETDTQVSYTPSSAGPGLGTLVPVNLKRATDDALEKLKQRVSNTGTLDDFVARELGYANNEEMWEGLGAEQVDGIAMMIDGLKRNPVAGSIIGDQTGIGKGRQVAAIIRWAIKNNRVPVFFTATPKLYVEMYDDMKQIGMQKMLGRNPRILVTNANLQLPLDRDDPKAKISTNAPKDHGQILLEHADPAKLKTNFDMVFSTYSQIQTIKGGETQRRQFMRRIALNAVFIFDESHKAGGQGAVQGRKPKNAPKGRADLVRELILTAGKRAIYSSATYAKRPDVMDLYAATDMGLSVEDPKELGQAIAAGGVPMQQVVAAMLVEAGQYMRRERSFDGVKYESQTVDVDRDTYNQISGSLMGIHHFSGFVKRVVKEIRRDMKDQGGTTRLDNAVGVEGADSTNFTSKLHNVINQILLAMKAEPAAQEAIAALQRGEKPVIAVSNTMESFLQQYAEDEGILVGKPMPATFNDVLQRNLDRSREIRIKKAFAEETEKYYLTDDDLQKVPGAIEAYREATRIIAELPLGDLPVSPIDMMRNTITKAGYTVSEITGRGMTVDYSGDQPMLARRDSKELSIRGKEATRAGFVDGSIDVVILNQSGAEGLSLHASERFKDQRRRLMIIAQAEGNIDTHMQILGRIHRTGQVVTPNYKQLAANVPAELRPMSILMKKMASLNANTTAARESAVTAKDVPDVMNEYGDEVAVQFIVDTPGMNEMLGNPVKFVEDEPEDEGSMRKLTGRLAMLPIEKQEEVWEYLIREYGNLLESKEAAGENALEAKVMPLKAVTLERTETVGQKNDSGSPFAAPVTVEKVRVTRLGKPYKATEIATIAAESAGIDQTFTDAAGATTWLQDAESSWTPLYRQIKQSQGVVMQEALGKFADYQRQAIEDIEDPKRMEAEQLRLIGIKNKWQRFMNEFLPGRRFTLKTTNGNLIAITLNVKQEGKPLNPLAMSTWKATFAIADAGKKVILPFSRISFDPSDFANVVEIGNRTNEAYSDTINWFEVMQGEAKETRYIATGNLLAAFDYLERKGKITHFTDDQGQIRQGVLTAKNFDLGKHAREHGRPLDTAELVDWLSKNKGRPLTDKNELVTIEQSYNGELYVSILGNKKKAGFLFTDTKLTAAAGLDFVQQGRFYRATVPTRNISPTLDRLAELQTKFSIPVTNLKTERMERQATPDEEERPMFFGKNAVSSRQLGTLESAERLENQGATPKQIWQKTGWFRRKDGKWRIEADASKWAFRPEEKIVAPRASKDVADVVASVLRWNDSDIAKAIAYQERDIQSTLSRIEELKRRGESYRTLPQAVEFSRKVLEAIKNTNVTRGLRQGRSQISGKTTWSFRGPLNELIHAPNLFAAYPDLANMRVEIGENRGLTGNTQFNITEQKIQIDSYENKDLMLRNLIHEVQHVIQQVEGFAAGGSDTTLLSRTQVALYEIEKTLEKLPDNSNMRPALEDMHRELAEQSRWFGGGSALSFGTNQQYDSYLRLLGEVEARNAETRRGMSAIDRMSSFPLDTEDTPQSEQFAGSDLVRVRPTTQGIIEEMVAKYYPSLPNMVIKPAHDETLDDGSIYHRKTEYWGMALTNAWAGDNAPAPIKGLRSNIVQSLKGSPEGIAKSITIFGARNLRDYVEDALQYELEGPRFVEKSGKMSLPDPKHVARPSTVSKLVALRDMLNQMMAEHPEVTEQSGYTVSAADPDKLIDAYTGPTWTQEDLDRLQQRVTDAIWTMRDRGQLSEESAEALAYDLEAQGIETLYGIKSHHDFHKLYDANKKLIDEYNEAYAYLVYRGYKRNAYVGQSFSINPNRFPMRDQMQGEIQKIVDQALGPVVKVEFPSEIKISPAMRALFQGIDLPDTAAGSFTATNILKVVLGTGIERETAYHEIFHGFVKNYANDQEKRLLEAETPRLRKRMAEIYDLTPQQAAGVDNEEVQATVAAAYQMWRNAGETGAGSGIHVGLRRILDKLWSFFNRIRNWAAGHGYSSFEDIAQDLYSGYTKRQRLHTAPRPTAQVKPIYKPFSIPQPPEINNASEVANDNESGRAGWNTHESWTKSNKSEPSTPLEQLMYRAGPMTFREAERLRQKQSQMLEQIKRDKRHYFTDAEEKEYNLISTRLRTADMHQSNKHPVSWWNYERDGKRGDVVSNWNFDESLGYDRHGYSGYGDYTYSGRTYKRVEGGVQREHEMEFGTLQSAQKWVEEMLSTGRDISDELHENEAEEVKARKVRLAREHMHIARRDTPLTDEITKSRERDVIKMFDAVEEGPKNQWRQLQEGEMYVRKSYDPMGEGDGYVFDVANIRFKEGMRGKGAFTEYLSLIEKQAKSRDYNAVVVESIENQRLIPFLERRGYANINEKTMASLPPEIRSLLGSNLPTYAKYFTEPTKPTADIVPFERPSVIRKGDPGYAAAMERYLDQWYKLGYTRAMEGRQGEPFGDQAALEDLKEFPEEYAKHLRDEGHYKQGVRDALARTANPGAPLTAREQSTGMPESGPERAAGLVGAGSRPRSLPPNMSPELLQRLRYVYKQQARAEESLAKIKQEITDWAVKQPREKGGGLPAIPWHMHSRQEHAERILDLAKQTRADVLRQMGSVGDDISNELIPPTERPAGLAGSGGAPSYPKRPFSLGTSTSEIRQALLSTWASAFQPEVISDRALQSDPYFARYRAARGQERDSIMHQSESWWNYWNKRTDGERMAFLHAVETNTAPTDPIQRNMFARFRAMLDRAFLEEQMWGSTSAFWADYFPHVWVDVAAASAWVQEQVRQLGPTWFQKRRYYDTIQAGLAAGLRLASSNPVDILTHRLLSGADLRMRMQLIYDLKNLGLAWEATQGGQQLGRRGWIPINAPDRKQWMIAPDIAYLWKNAVEARGLWQQPGALGKGFRGWMLLKNAYVPIKLMLSLFHPLHVLHINQSQYLAMGIREIATGNVRAGVGSVVHGLMTLPTGGLIDFFHGRRAKKGWEKRKTTMTPGEAAMVKIMEDGGFVPQLSEEQRINAKRSLAVAWQRAGSDPIFALKLPWHGFRRAIEMMQGAIFEHWIPALKAAAYLNEAASFFMRNPHVLNDDVQYRQALRTIGKSTDSRFGEMFYGALFQNAIFKQSMIAAFLSYGWNFGFVREFVGGALEVPARIAGKVMGETQTKQTQRAASNKIPFVIAYVSSAMMLAGMLGWALSGEPPEEWIDFIFPKLGGKNADGSKRRLSTMFYTREVPMLKKHIEEHGGNVLAGTADMVHNKLIIKPILDLITNRDYYGYEIRNSNDPAWKQFWQYSKYMLDDMSNPISVLGAKRAADLSGKPFPHGSIFDTLADREKAEQMLKSLGAPGVLEAILGFGPAPAYAEKTAIQNRIAHLYGEFVAPQLKPQERRETAEEIRGLRTALLNAKSEGNEAKIEELRKRGRELGLSTEFMNSVGKVPSDVYLFSRLPDEQQESLIRQMSPEEKLRYMPKAHPKVKQKFNREAEAASP